MRRAGSVTLALAGLCGLAAGPKVAGPADPDWVKGFAGKRAVLTVPGTDRIKVSRNVPCKRRGAPDLRLDVYAPPGPAPRGGRPAVVLVHGGPVPANLRTPPKEWGAFTSLGRLAAASGLVAVTFNHRLHGWDRLREARRDLDDVIAHLRTHSGELGVDGGRVSLWAFSAGGTLLGPSLRDPPPYLRCVVTYYALLDLALVRPQLPAKGADALVRDLSALQGLKRARGRVPALFIARAGLDDAGLNGALDRFILEALAQGAEAEVHNHARGRHGFDVLDDDDRSRAVLRRTLAFLREHG